MFCLIIVLDITKQTHFLFMCLSLKITAYLNIIIYYKIILLQEITAAYPMEVQRIEHTSYKHNFPCTRWCTNSLPHSSIINVRNAFLVAFGSELVVTLYLLTTSGKMNIASINILFFKSFLLLGLVWKTFNRNNERLKSLAGRSIVHLIAVQLLTLQSCPFVTKGPITLIPTISLPVF